jgi:hypothetical protein
LNTTRGTHCLDGVDLLPCRGWRVPDADEAGVAAAGREGHQIVREPDERHVMSSTWSADLPVPRETLRGAADDSRGRAARQIVSVAGRGH